MNLRKRIKAFSLAELLLSMGLFLLLVTSVATLSIDSVRAVRNSSSKVIAAQRIQELTNALFLNKDAMWSLIIANTGAGDKSLVYSANTYTFQAGAISDSDISVKFSISNVSRDGSGNIVTSGGTTDLHSRGILLTASWVDFLGITNVITNTVYMSDWNTIKLSQTTKADFDQGTNNLTVTTNTEGGEVSMESILYSDWCKPSLSLNMYDLPGQGIAKSVSAKPGNVYMGTGSNSSGVSFARMSFVPSEPPVVTVLGIFDGYKTNSIYGEGNYAYLATQTNSKEIVILDVSSTPYTEIGYFNPSINAQGRGVFVNGNIGIMATDNRLYTFNLTAKTGARAVISYITLRGTMTDMFVRGDFVYITLTAADTGLEILDISNPSSIQSVGWFDLSNSEAASVYVNEANTRAYVGTAAHVSVPEFFIVDVANKVGSHTAIGSYETNGMSALDIVVPENSNRGIVVGFGGTEHYQVVTLNNEANPQYCGGLAIPGVQGIAAVTESNGNVYSHVVTSNSSSELRTIRGGAGGGGAGGFGYNTTADYTSKVFDTQSATTQYFTLEWNATIASNSGVKLQIRGSDVAGMTGSTWVGSDGTNSTYFTSQQIASLPATLNNRRYLQYKAYFNSDDTAHTSLFNQIEITYQK